MRLLCDANIGSIIANALAAAGHDVVRAIHVTPRASDEVVLAHAVTDDRILVTCDRDFGELVFKHRASAPLGIIYIRFEPDDVTQIVPRILAVLDFDALKGHMTVIGDQPFVEPSFQRRAQTMPEHDYDVLVIGAGPGGYVAAIRAAQLGLRVACVESRETLGGTCLNVGCIPSKAMLHASEFYNDAANGMLAKLGIKVGNLELDLDTMHAQRRDAVKQLTGGIAFLFKKNKVEWLKGQARFVDAHSVQVGERTVTARDIVIATGSSVTPLPGVAIDQQVVVDSTGALELAKVPEHMVVIGGGVIGLELGSVWKRLGAKVTCVEFLDQILPGFDGEVRREANKIFKKQGIEFKLSTKVTGVAVDGGAATVTIEPAAGGAAETIAADVVLVSIGRRPNTEGLNLAAAGITPNARGQIEIDHDFRTSAPGVWAIGDVVPGPMLAHKAEDEGIAVAENIAGLTGIVNHDIIPSVVYTWPEIAGVGLTEEVAKERGEVKVGKFPMMANSRAKTNHEGDGFVKVIADAKTDRVLGVWVIASVGGTMIAQAAQAMEFGATSEDIAYTCHAHPTHAEALKEAAMGVRGKAIHI